MTFPFSLPELPYSADALLPYISEHTLLYHYGQVFSADIARLNRLIAPWPTCHNCTAEEMLLQGAPLPPAIHNEAQQAADAVYTHQLYFPSLSRPGTTQLSQQLHHAMVRDFGSQSDCVRILQHTATQCGRGWVWLCADKSGGLHISVTDQHHTPLPMQPLLALDMWRHAYGGRFAAYIEGLPLLLNWDTASQRYQAWMENRTPWQDG